MTFDKNFTSYRRAMFTDMSSVPRHGCVATRRYKNIKFLITWVRRSAIAISRALFSPWTWSSNNAQTSSFVRSSAGVYACQPETKQQSSQWKSHFSPRPQKARQSRSSLKSMLIIFFDIRGIVHREFLPEGQTVNKEFYCIVLWPQRKNVRRKRVDL